MSIIPQARGLIVCDRIDVDPISRNVSLINCFTRMRAGPFPSPARKFAVYAALTGGLGQVKIRVMVSRLADNRLVYSRDLPVEFRDRVEEVRFVLRLQEVVFPEAGQYVAELLADGEWVAQSVVNVTA